MRSGSVLSTLALAPLLIGAAKPTSLQPSSKWVLEYADNSCRLFRTFGEGNKKTTLLLESTAPWELSMLAIGTPARAAKSPVGVRFLPVQVKPVVDGLPQRATNGVPGVLWSRVALLPPAMIAELDARIAERKAHPKRRPPAISLGEQARMRAARQAFATAATQVEMEVSRGRPLVLETGSLGGPIKKLDECSRSSLRDWGVNPDIQDQIVRDVWAPNVASWFSYADYPNYLIGSESEVRVRLLVDAAGRPTQCTSLSHFDEPGFDKAVCSKFMARAKFEPAELADGTKVPSYYINRVVFQMAQ